MIGRWLDGLGDVERDRVIEAQGWLGGDYYAVDNVCLVAHAYGLSSCLEALTREPRVANRFDGLMERFGEDRVVKAIKARAARGVTSRVVEIAPEAVAR